MSQYIIKGWKYLKSLFQYLLFYEKSSKMNLIELPVEILEKIGDKLEGECSLNLRLTCSVLKKLIDSYIGVNVKLKEDPSQPYPKKMLNFINKTCISRVVAKNMMGQKEKTGMHCYFEKRCLFEDIFIFPHYLRTIVIMGKVHVQFFFDVLTKCINLEMLIMQGDGDVEFQENLFPFLIKEDTHVQFSEKSRSSWLSTMSNRDDVFRQIRCRKLKGMHLRFVNNRPGTVLPDNDFLNILLLLKCIRSETLERVSICLSEVEELTEMEYFQFSMIMVGFIQVHIRTMKDLSFSLEENKDDSAPTILAPWNNGDGQNQIDPNDFEGQGDSVEQQKIQMVTTLRNKLEIIGNCSKLTYLTIRVPSKFHCDYWLLFIESLRHLITLRILVSTTYKIMRNCFFIRNCRATLKRFRLDIDITHDFDYSGIEECTKLEEVYIFNRPTTPMTIEGPFQSQVKNVHLIPSGLKSLSFGNVVVGSADLNKCLAKQKNLDTLVILNMGSSNPENGADCKTLKKVFRMRHLHSCLLLNLRCKTRKTYTRIMQMLDFQIGRKERKLLKKVDKFMGYNPQIMIPQHVDIVSPEVFCRYIWEKNEKMCIPIGKIANYSMRYNDEDPYL